LHHGCFGGIFVRVSSSTWSRRRVVTAILLATFVGALASSSAFNTLEDALGVFDQIG
jgi:hypothetical protein